MAQADRVLFLVDAAADPGAAELRRRARAPPGRSSGDARLQQDRPPACARFAGCARCRNEIEGADATLELSALQGTGLDALRAHLLESAGFRREDSGTLSARRRHLEALAATAAFLDAADHQCRKARAAELVAEELGNAQRALGEITGAGTADELLGRIFATFCIGK